MVLVICQNGLLFIVVHSFVYRVAVLIHLLLTNISPQESKLSPPQTSPFPSTIPTVFLRKILRINTENFIPYLYAKALEGLWSGCCVAWVVGRGKMERFGVEGHHLRLHQSAEPPPPAEDREHLASF
jgi:hypothetical protein